MTAAPPVSRPAAAATPAATREIELKLLAADGDLDRLVRRATGRCRLLAPPSVRQVRTIYYDTPELELAAAGLALRLRQDGGRWLLALKTRGVDAGADRAAVAVRREWEAPLDGPAFDPALLDRIEAGGLAPADLRDRLAPRFETMVERAILLLAPADGAVVEMAVDRGAATAGDVTVPLSEIELELKEGPVRCLFDLALDLHAHGPLRIGAENKADIGARLLTGTGPRPAAAPPVGLSRLLTGGEALRHLMRHAIRHLMDNLACAGDDDSAGMAQIRAALRRLRLALRLIADDGGGGDLLAADLLTTSRWLSDRLAAPPRWDALTALLRDPILTGDVPAALRKAAAAMRRDAGRAAMRSLRAPRFTAFLLGLGRWVEDDRWRRRFSPAMRRLTDQPAAELAAALLAAPHDRADKAARRLARGEPDAAKSLRRRLRRLQLTADCCRGLFPPADVQPFAESLERLLEPLERSRDLTAAQRRLMELAAEYPDLQQDSRRLRQKIAGAAAEALQQAAQLCHTAPSPFWPAVVQERAGTTG